MSAKEGLVSTDAFINKKSRAASKGFMIKNIDKYYQVPSNLIHKDTLERYEQVYSEFGVYVSPVITGISFFLWSLVPAYPSLGAKDLVTLLIAASTFSSGWNLVKGTGYYSQ